MALPRVVNSKNFVVATESYPAQYRPSNQLNLEPSQATNPAFHASSDFRPGFLEYRTANYWGDMGLSAKVTSAGNRDLGVKAINMAGPRRTALPTTQAMPIGWNPMMPAQVPPTGTPADVAGLGGLGISATNPIVLSALGAGALGLLAYFLLRKKARR